LFPLSIACSVVEDKREIWKGDGLIMFQENVAISFYPKISLEPLFFLVNGAKQ
jgi:hypothetical protein